MNTRESRPQGNPPRDTRTNDRLVALVRATELTHAEALARFNRDIGLRPIAMSTWRGYFVNPESTRWRSFDERLLPHAEKVFRKRPRRP